MQKILRKTVDWRKNKTKRHSYECRATLSLTVTRDSRTNEYENKAPSVRTSLQMSHSSEIGA